MLLMLRTHAARSRVRACAFHIAALRRDVNPIDLHPRVCRQVSLSFDIDNTTKTTAAGALGLSIGAGEGDRRRSAVYLTMEEELRCVCGAAPSSPPTAGRAGTASDAGSR
jgi:hypothetical protein